MTPIELRGEEARVPENKRVYDPFKGRKEPVQCHKAEQSLLPGCTAETAVIKSSDGKVTENGLSRRNAPNAAQKSIRAIILPYGESLTGIKAGTVLGWEDAKGLPPGTATQRVARWEVEPKHAEKGRQS